MKPVAGSWNGLAGMPPEGAERERLFWLLQAAGWTMVGLLSLYPLGQVFSMGTIAVILALRVGSGILVTWGMRSIYRRIPWRRWPWWRLMAGVLVFCVVLGAIDSVSTHGLAVVWLGSPPKGELEMFVLLMGVLLRSSLFVIWSLLYFGIKLWLESAEARLQAAQSEAAARTSELKQLRAQVNPHFLFNALNSILAEKDTPRAVEQITQELAEYLRFSLKPVGDYQYLGEELDALEHYLRVEKARFEEKLDYAIEAGVEARRARVPVATVQPLLENAMKYGQRTSAAPLRVRLSAMVDGGAGELLLAVDNTGRWVESGGEGSGGIGLANLRRRLELLYGQEARLAHREEAGWVRVEVRLPVAMAAQEHFGMEEVAG